MSSAQTEKQVPERYACPVCGKRGRNAEWVSGVRIPEGYLHCNPKARTGGKGCGEVFKRITFLGCRLIRIPEVMRLEQQEEFNRQILVRMSEMGFRMIQAMKDSGVHEKYRWQRKVLNRDVYSLMVSRNGLCRCGCGNQTNSRGMFSENGCTDPFYRVAEMIANQGEGLRRFLTDLRGCKCEGCGKETRYLEVDHIIEVKNGGGICWIDNYQLLCEDCHKAKTARFAADRATARRIEKKVETGQQSLF